MFLAHVILAIPTSFFAQMFELINHIYNITQLIILYVFVHSKTHENCMHMKFRYYAVYTCQDGQHGFENVTTWF